MVSGYNGGNARLRRATERRGEVHGARRKIPPAVADRASRSPGARPRLKVGPPVEVKRGDGGWGLGEGDMEERREERERERKKRIEEKKRKEEKRGSGGSGRSGGYDL